MSGTGSTTEWNDNKDGRDMKVLKELYDVHKFSIVGTKALRTPLACLIPVYTFLHVRKQALPS